MALLCRWGERGAVTITLEVCMHGAGGERLLMDSVLDRGAKEGVPAGKNGLHVVEEGEEDSEDLDAVD